MASELILHPAFLVLLGGVVLPLLPPGARGKALPLFPLAALWVCWRLSADHSVSIEFLEYRLSILQVDRLSRIFGIVFSLIGFAGGLFALHLRDVRQQVAALLYAGSALGLVFSGDWLTLFLFWELTALSSTVLIWSRQGTGPGVGLRYLLVHLFGGSLLLAGILGQMHATGDIALQLLEAGRMSSWLILGGIAVNAAVPPLHAWLSDAYPKATVVCVTGEGSFMMNMQELSTCLQYGLPIKIVCVNNQALGMVKQWQDMQYGGRLSQSTYSDSLPDFKTLVEAFGHVGFRVETPGDLHEAMRETFSPALKDKLVFLDAWVDPDEHVYPMAIKGGSMRDMYLDKITTSQQGDYL